IVLGRMLDTGVIDKASYTQAIAAPVTSRLHGAQITASAPYIAEMVRQEMVNRFGEEVAYSAGLQVYTTVHSVQQAAAKTALQQNLYNYDERHGYRGPVKILWPAKLAESTDAGPLFIEQEPLQRQDILSYLSQHSSLEDLHHAVVTSVSGQAATAILA